jgi:AcrR family transcriptional regulator
MDRAAELRADARRNVAAILAAATDCLARNPDTSVAEIAAAAGVGRMTLYGHFKTRGDLLDAVLAQVITEAHQALGALDLSGDPRDALARLAAASWRLVSRLRNILAAAQRELPAERIRQAHDPVLGQVRALVERGRSAGAFRTDLPTSWLVSLAMNVMHAAAAEVSAGSPVPAVTNSLGDDVCPAGVRARTGHDTSGMSLRRREESEAEAGRGPLSGETRHLH